MSAVLILPCPSLSPTEQAERAITDVLVGLDQVDDLIGKLEVGVYFDTSLEIRAAHRLLVRALATIGAFAEQTSAPLSAGPVVAEVL
jgi:hypothetical protein